MSTRHRRDAVAPRLLASDAPVAVVVPQAQCIGFGRWWRARCAATTVGPSCAGDDNLRRSAAGEHAFEGGCFATVDCQAYLRLTATTRAANQHRFMGGSHSAGVVGALARTLRCSGSLRARRGSG